MQKFTEKEISMFTQIRKSIDDLVNEKIHEAQQAGKQIQHEKIQMECEKLFFENLRDLFFKSEEETKKFIPILQKDLPELATELMKRSKDVLPKIQACKTLGELMQIGESYPTSSQDIQKMYAKGLEWFEKENYDTAYLYFAYLTLIQGNNPEMWFVKGMAEQNLHRIADALNSFSMTITLAPQYLQPYIQMMECLILDGQIDQAAACYQVFIKEIDPKAFEKNSFLNSRLKNIEEYLKHPV